MTKLELHKKVNEAFEVLFSVCLELNLKAYYKVLKRSNSFLALLIDTSDFPFN